jgi:hypothetical protein
MPRVAKKFVKWKVTLDGVEIPWQNISLQVGVDFSGQLQISMEPDPILRDLRAGTKVHLLMYDPDAPGGDDDLDKLFIYWAGDLRSPRYQRSHGSRSITIVAAGAVASFGRSKMYAHGFGTVPNTHLVSGSTLVSPKVFTPKQLVNYTILGKMFDPNVKNATKKEIPFRDSKEANYAERVLRFMSYLSSYNALFRMQAVRANIFGKIASFHDESLGRLLPRALINDYFTQARTSVKPDSTILDLIHLINGMTFYHLSSIAGPVVPSTKVGDDSSPTVPVDEVSYIGFPGVEAEDHLYSMPRRFLRNDYIFMPETFYAIPPSCNLIFPEFINSFDLGRDFMTEPTRALITNTHLNSQLSVVAPDNILRFVDKPDPAQFWSLNQDGIKVEGNVTSPYESRSVKGGPSYNLFGAVTDEEIEKGIIAVTDYPSYEFFSAVSNTFDLKTTAGSAYLDGLLDEETKMAADAFEGKSSRDRSFLHMMKALADYTLTLEKFRREVSISLVGHRWIVPGFPCVIMDTTASFIAYVKSYNVNISPNGDELGTVGLDFVRPFPLVDRKTIQKAEKAVESLSKMESEVKKFSERISEFRVQISAAHARYKNALTSDNVDEQDNQFAKIRRTFGFVYNATRRDTSILSRMGVNARQMDNVSSDLNTHRPSGVAGFTNPVLQEQSVDFAVNTINKYYNAVEESAGSAAKSMDHNKVPNMQEFGDPSKNLKETISSSSLGDDYPDDFMVPPIFGNMDLLSVKGSEEIYNNLFGAKVVFSSEEGFKTEAGIHTDPGTTARVIALKKQAYTKFVNWAKALDRIFPVLGTSVAEDEGEAGTSEWEERSSKKDSDESLRDWAETKFLKRERLQTLRQFLKVNGLKLLKPLSTPPVQQSFLHFAPAKTFDLPSKSDLGPLTWDNTLFSKIVDEFQIQKKDVKLRNDAGEVTDNTILQDKRIRELRQSVKNPFLTTTARQAIILDYASRHHGSRGFGGS